MAPWPAREYLSKSDAIRQYLLAHPGARPHEVVSALESQGISISTALVSKIRFDRPIRRRREARPANPHLQASGAGPAGGRGAAIRAKIDEQGQRFRPRDIIAALAADGIDVSLAEVIMVAQSLGLRPRKRS